MKPFKSEDGLQVWRCQNGFIAFNQLELSPAECAKLIAYLANMLSKELPND